MNSFNLLIRYGGIAAGISLIYWYKALSALYVGTIVAEALVLVIIYVVISARLSELAVKPSLSKEHVKEAFSYGLPLAVSGLLSYFLSSTDRYVIGYFLSAESVADYTVAINFCNYPIEILRNVYLATFVPLIMNSWNKVDSGEINTQNITNFVASYFWLAVPIVCGLAMTDVEGIKLLAGNRYAAVPYLTPLMATSFALNGMSFVYIAGLLYKKRTKAVLYLNVSTGILNLILNLILVPSIGIYGAAIASLSSYSIFILIASRLSRREMTFEVPVKDIVLSISAGIFMLVMYKTVSNYGAVKFTLAIKMLVGIISYAAFVLLFAKSRVRTLTNAFKPSAVTL
jgi:O-antigen/teichoic acid export membrane protein